MLVAVLYAIKHLFKILLPPKKLPGPLFLLEKVFSKL